MYQVVRSLFYQSRNTATSLNETQTPSRLNKEISLYPHTAANHLIEQQPARFRTVLKIVSPTSDIANATKRWHPYISRWELGQEPLAVPNTLTPPTPPGMRTKQGFYQVRRLADPRAKQESSAAAAPKQLAREICQDSLSAPPMGGRRALPSRISMPRCPVNLIAPNRTIKVPRTAAKRYSSCCELPKERYLKIPSPTLSRTMGCASALLKLKTRTAELLFPSLNHAGDAGSGP